MTQGVKPQRFEPEHFGQRETRIRIAPSDSLRSEDALVGEPLALGEREESVLRRRIERSRGGLHDSSPSAQTFAVTFQPDG